MGKVLTPGPRLVALGNGRILVKETSVGVRALPMGMSNTPSHVRVRSPHITGAISTATAIRDGTKPL